MSIVFVHSVQLRGFCLVFICFICMIYSIITKQFQMYVSF